MRALTLAVMALFLGMDAVAGQTLTASYPQKPIHIIVPTTAGSTPDVVARFVGDKLAAALNQSIVIEKSRRGRSERSV
jgi:tripartite-type tricarboxylate transporter receptor subunit TctC